MLRAATAVVAGSFVVALALSLVGVNAGASDQSPAVLIGILASIVIAAVLIWRSRATGAEPL
jgi:Na+/melibiose symporter-like transporter